MKSNLNCYLEGRDSHVAQRKYYPYDQLGNHPIAQRPSFLEKSVFENLYLLLPSVFGTGIAYLISLKSEFMQNVYIDYSESTEQGTEQNIPDEYASSLFKLIGLTYVFGSIVCVAMFIYRSEMGSYIKKPLNALLPIGIGLVAAIFLFASVNLAMFVLFPTSFTGQVGKNWAEKAISFVCYSALVISVGPVGDIVPAEMTTRVLLAMEGLANLVIFSLLIASVFR